MHCPHQNECSGCSLLHLSPEEESNLKTQRLRDALKVSDIVFPDILYLPVADQELRDRVDLTISSESSDEGISQTMGFLDQSRTKIFPLDRCPLLNPKLQNLFERIKKIHFGIRKGSLRLRVSPSGIYGIWLDFANLDIKKLIEEKTILQQLLEIGIVEVGQKRKKLSPDLKLIDPEPEVWTQTWLTKTESLDLFSCIGSFSQSGRLANKIIVHHLIDLFILCEPGAHWLEFGAGNGNLSFPLLRSLKDSGGRLTALEFDPLAIQGFKKSLLQTPDLAQLLEIQTGDFQNKNWQDFQRYQAVLVNPPRSGLGQFLKPMSEISLDVRPKDFIYMSCHLDSFQKDSRQLKNLGYHLKNLSLIDQFPHSNHFEILSRWKRQG